MKLKAKSVPKPTGGHLIDHGIRRRMIAQLSREPWAFLCLVRESHLVCGPISTLVFFFHRFCGAFGEIPFEFET
jgi:hypothetical protein